MKIFGNRRLLLTVLISAFVFMTSTNTALGAGPISFEDNPVFEIMDRYHLPDSADDLAWNREGNKLVVGSWPERRGLGKSGFDSHVAVFELNGERLNKTHEFILNPAGKGDDVVTFSPDDRYIAVGNTTVELFDLQENRRMWVTEHGAVKANRGIFPDHHFSIAFSENGRHINTVGEEQLTDDSQNTAIFWGNFDIKTGAYTVAHKTNILYLPHAVATTRDGWSVTPEMTVKGIIPRRYWVSVREMGTGKEVSRLEPILPPGASSIRSALAVSPDGRYLAFAGDRDLDSSGNPINNNEGIPGKVRMRSPYLQIWNIAESRLLYEHLRTDFSDNESTPLPTSGAIRSLDISADGKWLLMQQSNEGRAPDLHIFNMENGQRVWSSIGSVGHRRCRFAPTKNVFACAGYKEILVFKKND